MNEDLVVEGIEELLAFLRKLFNLLSVDCLVPLGWHHSCQNLLSVNGVLYISSLKIPLLRELLYVLLLSLQRQLTELSLRHLVNPAYLQVLQLLQLVRRGLL